MKHTGKYAFVVLLIFCAWFAACTGLKNKETRSENIAELAKNLIVKIETANNKFGAGIIFGVNGCTLFIATAKHVVNGAESASVEFAFSRNVVIPAEIKQRHPKLDLAVLQVNLREIQIQNFPLHLLPFTLLGDVIDEGESVYPVGHPIGETWNVPAIPTKVTRIIAEELRFDPPQSGCHGGHSGGGLFNAQWRLVGMILRDRGMDCEAISFDRIRITLEKEWNLPIGRGPLTCLPLPTPTPIQRPFPPVAIGKIQGSCQDFDFPRDAEGNIDWVSPIRVLKQDAPVYKDFDSLEIIDHLNFNKALEIVGLQGNRIAVQTLGGIKPLGWVERADLLCGLTPLRSETGLEKKIFITIAPEVRLDELILTEQSFKFLEKSVDKHTLSELEDLKNIGYRNEQMLIDDVKSKIKEKLDFPEVLAEILKYVQSRPTQSSVNAYSSPDLIDCSTDQCRRLSRFTGYYIFGESERRYLIGETFHLKGTDLLIGWIDKKNGILWDTAYGLRPREKLIFPENHPQAGQERAICAYPGLQYALSDKLCQPILGGERWYLYANRIPILDWVIKDRKAFYKVALPLVGIEGEYDEQWDVITINSELLTENQGISSLSNMKHVDIMFLIDGTAGMEPYIQAVGDAVRLITETLQNHPDFKASHPRFGYRIYRDAFAGDLELDEGMPLSNETRAMSKEKQEELIQKFERSIKEMLEQQAQRRCDLDWKRREQSDDYPENLFGGINQALIDLSASPHYTKILFVIGDCGYDAEAQKRRGRTPVTEDALVRKMKGSVADGSTTTVTFFLQPPKLEDSTTAVGRYDEYAKAYKLFMSQARSMLSKLLDTTKSETIENYFMNITDTDLPEKVLAGVKQFSNAAVINELELDLRGGAALVDTIEHLQGEYNLPGLFLNRGQDTKSTHDIIIESYIPMSEDVVEDGWMTSKDLNSWILILKSIGNMSGVSVSELRETWVSDLKDALERVICQPLYNDTAEPLAVFIQRKSRLPVRDDSPLFRYSIDDLMDSRVVPDCELIRLVTWVSNVTEILGIVRHGDMRPVYTAIPFPGECPSGEDIPFIDGPITHKSLGSDPKMRYDHNFQNAHIYWIPKEFLP